MCCQTESKMCFHWLAEAELLQTNKSNSHSSCLQPKFYIKSHVLKPKCVFICASQSPTPITTKQPMLQKRLNNDSEPKYFSWYWLLKVQRANRVCLSESVSSFSCLYAYIWNSNPHTNPTCVWVCVWVQLANGSVISLWLETIPLVSL